LKSYKVDFRLQRIVPLRIRIEGLRLRVKGRVASFLNPLSRMGKSAIGEKQIAVVAISALTHILLFYWLIFAWSMSGHDFGPTVVGGLVLWGVSQYILMDSFKSVVKLK